MNYFHEIGYDANEGIDQTGIHGFEESGLITDRQMADYLQETIPPEHITECPSIEFDPQDTYFRDHPTCEGYYDTASHEIHINQPADTGGTEELLDTVVHEIGHNAHAWLEVNHPDLAARWNSLHEESLADCLSTGHGLVSSYASTDAYEDFAESYRAFCRDPERLIALAPEKYEYFSQSALDFESTGLSAIRGQLERTDINTMERPGHDAPILSKADMGIVATTGDATGPTYRCFDKIA